jgi:hypothetical protein
VDELPAVIEAGLAATVTVGAAGGGGAATAVTAAANRNTTPPQRAIPMGPRGIITEPPSSSKKTTHMRLGWFK